MKTEYQPKILLDNGKEILGVPTGVRGKNFALTRISALKNEQGWIVTGNKIKEWKIDGFTVHEGEIFLYGPGFPGSTLMELLNNSAPKSSLSDLKLLVNALTALYKHGVKPFKIQADSIIFSENGSILFLPPKLMENVNAAKPAHYRIDVFDKFNNPVLNGEDASVFTIGIIAYKLSTGEYPFNADSEEEIHERIRTQDVLPPQFIVPGIRDEISGFIMESLKRDKETGRHESSIKIPGLAHWEDNLEQWLKSSVYRTIDEDKKNTILKEAQIRKERVAKYFNRRVFWQRNRTKILTISLIIIISGAVLGSIMKNVFAPRLTHGYTPIEVVKAFYNSMNTLDSQKISDCVIDKAGKEEVNQVTNLYVISRVSMGYGGKSNIMSAVVWNKKGRPPLKPPLSVYGVLDLNIKTLSPEPEPVFLAEYHKWVPVSEDENTGNTKAELKKAYQGFAVTDKLYLKKDRGDWVIYRIERLNKKPILK
ncbi:MAG: hypothetical protein GXP33_06440 [Spirochaetes bacterium]|nr:hypothetical protein [Spirochaetota bacterium]